MGRFERVIAALEALPEERREEIISVLEEMVRQESGPSLLNAEQTADLQRRLANPEPFASDEEVETFFASLRD